MNHLSDDRLYDLAVKIASRGAFTQQDVAGMHHISRCDDCYQMLCCVMAMQDISMHLADFGAEARSAESNAISAVINPQHGKTQPLADRLESEIATWSFYAPALSQLQASNSLAVLQQKHMGSSHAFVAYDPAKNSLVIQIDCSEDADMPCVRLKHPNGRTQSVALERQGPVLRGEVSEPEEGRYELVLSKS